MSRYLCSDDGQTYRMEQTEGGLVMVSEFDGRRIPVTEKDLRQYSFTRGYAGTIPRKCAAFVAVTWQEIP